MSEPANAIEAETPALKLVNRADRYPYSQQDRATHNLIAYAIAREQVDKCEGAPKSIPYEGARQASVNLGALEIDEVYRNAVNWAFACAKYLGMGDTERAERYANLHSEAMDRYRQMRGNIKGATGPGKQGVIELSARPRPVITYWVVVNDRRHTFTVDWGSMFPEPWESDLRAWADLHAERGLREYPHELVWRVNKGSLVLRDRIQNGFPHLARAFEHLRLSLVKA
jgi:hypothetical protein